MTRLDRLRKSLLEMHPDEMREYVRRIRKERRITKERPATKVARKRDGSRAKDALAKLLGEMTNEQRNALLRDLGHDDNAADEGRTAQPDNSQG